MAHVAPFPCGLSDLPWNEIIVDGRGNAYLNNIGFEMMAGEQAGPPFNRTPGATAPDLPLPA